jgi:hypothetical protein
MLDRTRRMHSLQADLDAMDEAFATLKEEYLQEMIERGDEIRKNFALRKLLEVLQSDEQYDYDTEKRDGWSVDRCDP